VHYWITGWNPVFGETDENLAVRVAVGIAGRCGNEGHRRAG
jgi:hypothetical protein